MDNNNLIEMGYEFLQLSIKLPENSDVNVIISSPYEANAVVGMYFCVIMVYVHI